MTALTPAKATLCIVNYKTLQLTRLCLRSIRKYTEYPCDVIVIDNDSQDESLDYLKSLSWIRLIERRPSTPDPGGSYAHGRALDLGLDLCQNEFFVSLHSDTVILRSGWLRDLVAPFQGNPKMACVGGGKIELKPAWKVRLKRATDFKAWQRHWLGHSGNPDFYRYWNRTNCSVYRTAILKSEGLSFQNEPADTPPWKLTVGQKLYFHLVEHGYDTLELSDRQMNTFIAHLAHGTQAINAAEFPIKGRAVDKYQKVYDRILNTEAVQSLLKAESWDQA